VTSQTYVSGAQILDGTIKNVDVATDAAIAFSKLAALSAAKVLVGSAGNVAVAVDLSGDLTITNAGVATIANSAITDVKVSATAAIAYTKLAGAAGVDAAFAAVAAAATDSAQAGQTFTIAASAAVAGTLNAGAAAGGAVAINAGNAAYLTSGNAGGGAVTITAGSGANAGAGGNITLTGGSTSSGASGSILLVPGSGGVAGAVVIGGVAVGSQTALLKIVTNTTGIGQMLLGQASADADSFDILYQKSRGTTASPTVITTADELGTIQFMGYSGAGGYVVGAAIKAYSSGTIATTRVPGELRFYTGTDAAPSVLTQRMSIDNAGKVGIGGGLVIGTAALATTATDGFLYIPTCAGPPTGTPTAQTGTVALVYDTTNGTFNIRNGGVWNFGLPWSLTQPPVAVPTQATTLSGNGGSITSGATSMLVASSAGFPAVPFLVVVGTEDIKVTAVSSLTWTIVRGYNATTAAAHNDGVAVTQINWEWINSGSTTVSQITNSGIYMNGQGTSALARRLQKRLMGSFTQVTACFMPNIVNLTPGKWFFSLVMRESATGKCEDMFFQMTTHGTPEVNVERVASPFGNGAATNEATVSGVMAAFPIWLRAEVVGANMVWSISGDGVNFITFLTIAKTTPFTTAPDEWGYSIGSLSTAASTESGAVTLVSWVEA
jgi:hypothetical protein